MLTIPGSAAVSQFRLDNLLNKLKSVDADIVSVTANYLHFVQCDEQVNDDQIRILRQLLNYGDTSYSSLGAQQQDEQVSVLFKTNPSTKPPDKSVMLRHRNQYVIYPPGNHAKVATVQWNFYINNRVE